MRICHVNHWTEHFELARPYTIAYDTIEAVDNEIVRIETDNGLTGMGAASPGPEVTGESIADCRNALKEHLYDLLVGCDICDLVKLLRKLEKAMPQVPAARTAIDMALFDLAAQSAGKPLADLLGRVHSSLPTSVTIGIDSIREMMEEARALLRQGFRILKIKLGDGLEKDVERLHKLCEHVGGRALVRVDINQAYTVDQYKAFFKSTAELGLEMIEQPLQAGEIEGMRCLPERMRRIAAADESLINTGDALTYTCPPKPFGIYNIKLMKCGGIYPALKMADIARTAGIDLMWGCNDESIVSIAAALHAALASPATRFLDLDGSLDLARDIVVGGFVLENGELRVTNQPGLGVAPL